MEHACPRSLLVQSDPDVCDVLRDQLEADGYSIDAVNTGKDALGRFQNQSYDIVLLDILLRDLDGLCVLKQLKRANASVPVIVLTCYSHPETVREVMNEGVFAYMVMPHIRTEIKDLLQRAIAESGN